MFQKGHKKIGGRPPGGQNMLTKTVRERVLEAFTELQKDSHVNLVAWAMQEPTEFYKIASKLIPTEINANVQVVKLGKDLEDEQYQD